MAGILGGGAGGEADGREGDDADQGAAQQRPDGALDDAVRNFEFLRAALDTHENALGHHDRVVHHHAQGDDERAEGDAVHGNVDGVHRRQGGENRHQQDRADHDGRPQPHEYQQRDDDDDQRGDHVDDEDLHRFVDDFSLVVEFMELDAQGAKPLAVRDFFVDGRADFHDVSARYARYAQRNRRFAVVAIEFFRRLAVPPPHARDVLQENHFSLVVRGYEKVLDRLDGVNRPGGIDHDAPIADFDVPRRDDGVLPREGVVDVGYGKPQGGRVLTGYLDENRFPSQSVQRYAGDALHLQQRALQGFAVAFELGGRITIAGNEVEQAEDVPEIIRHVRRIRAGRQGAGGVFHLVAQLGPDELKVGFGG